MMQLQEVSAETFEKFAVSHPYANFFQSHGMAGRRNYAGWKNHFVLAYEGETVVAGALLQSRKVIGNYRDFECLQGPLVDYSDLAMVEQFFEALKHYLKGAMALNVTVKPPVAIRIHRDETIEHQQGENCLIAMKKSGYRHISDTAVDKNPLYLRWYYTKALHEYTDWQEVLGSFDLHTRRAIKNAEKFGIRISEINDPKELPGFFDIISMTSTRRGFDGRSLKYYTSMFEAFPRDQAMFVMAHLDKATYRDYLDKRVSEYNQELINLSKKSNISESRLANIKQSISETNRIKDEIPTLFGNKKSLPLAASLLMCYGDEVVYFMGGSRPELARFCGPSAIQAFGFQHALEHDKQLYNFYGTHGTFDGHPEQDGVYKYKQGYNGQLEEFVGYFRYTFRPTIAHPINTLRSLKQKTAQAISPNH